MNCKICNKYSGKRKTCSDECLKISLSNGGKATINKNRPTGEDHYLWKGGRENRNKWMKDYKDNHKDRHLAHQAISDAKRRGKIKQLPCSVCGDEKSEAHHEDYSKRLDVIWLCRKHHREADRRLGVGSRDFK